MLDLWLAKIAGYLWNYPVIVLCLFTGVFFTLRMAFVQIRCLPHALALVSGKYDNPNEAGHITHFQALSAALSGTIGLGNIAGVAIAIAMGGPGAVFWMCLIAFFAMATKYTECALGTIYREVNEKGQYRGGPMYYITKGLGERWKPLAIFFAVCCAIGCFGFANMFQANQVASALNRYYGVPDWLVGAVLATGVGLSIIGGIKRIGAIASKIVPFMCVCYVAAALFVCFVNLEHIPSALSVIITDAFSGNAAAGGVIGAVIITGVRRAVFSNEAGLGSAPIAHAAVKTDYPIREGIVASIGPLIDTILVCSATAIVIILSGNYGTERFEETQTIDFTSSTEQQQFALSGGWGFSDQGIPPSTNDLQRLRTGDFALVFNGGQESGSATTPPLRVYAQKGKGLLKQNVQNGRRRVADGLRFSSNYSGKDLRVEVLDKNQQLIGPINIGEQGGEFAFTGNQAKGPIPWMRVNSCSNSGEWCSYVIQFTPEFQRHIRKNPKDFEQLHLRFIAESGSSTWYIDRPQAVKELAGIDLTSASFDRFFQGFGGFFIAIAVCFFSYSTMITWFYYGETAGIYVWGEKISLPFRWLYCIAAFCGCIIQLSIVLNFSDIMAALMVIPNTIAILLLSPIVSRETKSYLSKLKAGEFDRSSTAEKST